MLIYVLLIVISFILVLISVSYYIEIAHEKKILAHKNFRTLHDNVVPRGGGVVFSLVFILNIVILYFLDKIDSYTMLAVCIGGTTAVILGFIDDIRNIGKTPKLISQFCLAIWILLCFKGGYLITIRWMPVWLSIFITVISLIWLMNSYNFMDGVDGMAISGSVSICGTLILVLFITNGSKDLILFFLLLAVCSFAFLISNWPPAKIFMGDSGSIFLGYIFGAMIIKTTLTGDISLWTWLIVFGYFIADTTTTTIMRIILVKKWYGEHRGHAYQNLARIWGSHLKVTGYVLLFHVLWLLPLAIWSGINVELAPFAVFLALLPPIIFSFKYGTRLSSK